MRKISPAKFGRAFALLLAGCLLAAGCSNAFTGSVKDVSSASTSSRALIAGYTTAPATADGGVILHAYMWSFADIEAALPTIAAAGYTGVQVSPIQGTKENSSTWWLMYQPTNFAVGNYQLGDEGDFQSLCSAADAYGIKIIVDAVLNHVADNGTCGVWADAVDSSLKRSDFYHNRGACDNYADRESVTQENLSNLPDLNTQNSEVQAILINFLEQCVADGADGFRFDAAKHIETTSGEDSGKSWAGSFWTNALSALSGNSLYMYGEVLPGSGDNHEVYASYFDITAHGYIWTVLNGVNNKDLSGVLNYNHDSTTLAPAVSLCYIENHDSYQDGSTTSQSYWTRKMANAVLIARSGITTLVLDRPNEDLWKDADLIAMNIFHNKMTGTSEYLRWYGNETLVVERGNKGIAIINTGSSSKYISVASTLASGTYTNHATQSATMTISGGYLTGTIPAGNVVVLYNDTVTVPTAPTSLTAGTVTRTTVPLTWTASSGATSYNIYQAAASDGNYSLVGTSTSNSYTATGLLAGTAYLFKVSAINSAGTSDCSTAITATTKSSTDYLYTYGAMYLRGSMNSWGGTAMTLTGDYTWTVSQTLTAGTVYTYKYEIGGATSWSTNWGFASSSTASSTSGTASASGYNMYFTPTTSGTYVFTFNDSTKAYSVITGTPTCATPTFSVASGSAVAAGSTVTITSSTSGSTIYYTTDGTTPTTSSSSGTAGAASATVTVSSACTVKALAVLSGYTTSGTASASYTIAACAAPTFSVTSGSTISTSASVTLSTTTSGATIYYTTDGTTPTTASSSGTAGAASATVALSGTAGNTVTVKAIAVLAGYTASAASSVTYTYSSSVAGRLNIVFVNNSSAQSVTFPGDFNSWSLTSNKLTAAASSTNTIVIDGAITATTLAKGDSTSALEFQVCNQSSGWSGAWNFSTWTKGSGLTVANSKQITIPCTAANEVTLTINVATTTISVTVTVK